MQSTRRRDTRPELEVRALVHAMGLRYRVDAAPSPTLRRRADLLFKGPRVAVLIDGCFWHGCPLHYIAPATHSEFWAKKVETNRARDRDTNHALAREGWAVLRLWEHEEPQHAANVIAALVRERTSRGGAGSVARGEPTSTNPARTQMVGARTQR